MNEHKYHLVLLGVAAIVVFILLRRHAASIAGETPAAPEAAPTYPNAQPINMGDVNVEGSPSYLTINNGVIPDTVGIGDGPQGCGCGASCSPVNLTAKNIVPAAVVEAAQKSYAGYVNKVGKRISSAPVDSEAA